MTFAPLTHNSMQMLFQCEQGVCATEWPQYCNEPTAIAVFL